MERRSAAVDRADEYDYADDFTDASDDNELPLPGLSGQPDTLQWTGADDWRLPGVLAQTSRDDDARSSRVGESSSARLLLGNDASPNAATSPASAADAYQRDPWVRQRISVGRDHAATVPRGSSSGAFAAPYRRSSSILHQLRRTPASPTRNSSGAFGPLSSSTSSGVRSRDSLPALQPQQQQPQALHSSLERRGGSNVAPYRHTSSRSLYNSTSLHSSTSSSQQQLQQHTHSGAPPPSRQQLLPPVQLRQSQQQQRSPPPPLQPPPQQPRQPFSRGGGTPMVFRDSYDDSPRRGVGTSGGLGTSDGGGGSGGGGGGGGGGLWPNYIITDPYARALSSSYSSSASGSPSNSPPPRLAPAHFPLQAGSSSGQQQWYSTQYSNPQYDQDFGLGLGLGLGRAFSGGEDSGGGLLSRDGEGRSLGLVGHRMSGYGLGLGVGVGVGQDPGRSLSSSDSSRSSHSGAGGHSHGRGHRWDGGGSTSAGGGGGQYDMGGSRSSGAGGVSGNVVHLPPLWPSAGGGGGEERHLESAASSAAAGGWRAQPMEGPRHSHMAGGGGSGSGGLSGRWRPTLDDDDGVTLASPVGGSGIPQLRGVGEPAWERRYGGMGAGTSYSPSYGMGLGMGTNPNRYSARSGMGSGGLGLGGLGTLGSGSGAQNDGRGSASGSGLNRGGFNGDDTRCFASLDTPGGPYDRRRVVLTSASRRLQPPLSLEPVAPTVRQYSDGLAGVLTNAQIQEWMSQHASRLLLPRHMHEIADIVFRPPSAVPEKKPPKCQPEANPIIALPPPVVLGGLYPRRHVSRLASDPGFMSSLLSSLEGVDPSHSRVQAVVSALQGRDVVARDTEEPAPTQQQQQQEQPAAASSAALAGKMGRSGSGLPARY